jgi:DNA-binding phage protein
MTRTERARWVKKRTHWATENSAYLHRLLSERDPEYLAALRSAERQIDRELARAAAGMRDEGKP